MGRGRKRPAATFAVTSDQDGGGTAGASKKTKSLYSSCPICEQVFEPGQESIFCKGDC